MTNKTNNSKSKSDVVVVRELLAEKKARKPRSPKKGSVQIWVDKSIMVDSKDAEKIVGCYVLVNGTVSQWGFYSVTHAQFVSGINKFTDLRKVKKEFLLTKNLMECVVSLKTDNKAVTDVLTTQPSIASIIEDYVANVILKPAEQPKVEVALEPVIFG